MRIREAQFTDAAAIARVHVDSWRSTYRDMVPADYLAALSYEKGTQAWQIRLSIPNNPWFAYVAELEEGPIVGFGSGGPERTGDPLYSGELGALYLLAPYHRQGIGRRLVQAVAYRLIQQGHDTMIVWVLAANPARHFYEALSGQLLNEKEIEIGGANLVEVSYGWQDLKTLAGLANP